MGITIDLHEDVVDGVWVNGADNSPTSYEDEASVIKSKHRILIIVMLQKRSAH